MWLNMEMILAMIDLDCDEDQKSIRINYMQHTARILNKHNSFLHDQSIYNQYQKGGWTSLTAIKLYKQFEYAKRSLCANQRS